MERNLQKQLYGISRESSPGARRYSMPAASADSTRKSIFGGSASCAQMSGSLKRTALTNRYVLTYSPGISHSSNNPFQPAQLVGAFHSVHCRHPIRLQFGRELRLSTAGGGQ